MTSAGGGGSGMDYGPDYVSARLSVDIPEGAAQGIQELQQAVERFRITMEATTRAEADMTRYLEQMADAGKRTSEIQATLIQQMQTIISLSARTSGVPTGGYLHPDSFGAGEPGTGGTTGVRPRNPADVHYQLEENRLAQPAAYLNMQQARGQLTATDMVSLSRQSIQELANKIADRERAQREQAVKTDPEAGKAAAAAELAPSGGPSMAERIQRGSGLAGRVMNEMGPGGSATGMAQMAVQGLQWARDRTSHQAPGRAHEPTSSGTPDAPGMPPEGTAGRGSHPGAVAPKAEAPEDSVSEATGGLSGITKMLGPIAGVATSALAIFGLIQKGGETIQGMRNIGALRGGAAGEGFQADMRTRMMAAMNPFINKDQARQIFQAAMSEGYADASGGGADNVIDFMSQNLTKMNISVADSAKMLRSTIQGNVVGDKESVTGAVQMLRKELDSIKTISRDSVISTPDFTSKVMSTQEALTKAGVSPADAMRAAMTAESVGRNDHVLQGQFANSMQGLAGTSRGNMMLRMWGGQEVPAELDPEMTAAYLSKHGKLEDAAYTTMRREAQMAAQRDSGTEAGHFNAIRQFQRMASITPGAEEAAGDAGVAEAYYNSLREGKSLAEAKERIGKEHLPTRSGASDERGGRGGGESSGQSSRGSQNVNVSGGVTITLTPEASRLLQVQGGSNVVPLTSNQRAANRGHSGAQVNDPPA